MISKIKRTAIVMFASILLSVSLSPAILAMSSSEGGSNTSRSADAAATAAANKTRLKEKIEDRVAESKKNLQKKLTSADEQRIKTKCKAAQQLITNYTKKVDEFEKNRQERYSKIIERLESLSTKLTAAGRTDDAASVQTVKAEFQAKVDEVYAATDDFQQTLSDLSSVDCVSDPTAFQAVLEAARQYRAAVNEKSKAVRSYYTETLIKALSVIKNNLSANGGSN